MSIIERYLMRALFSGTAMVLLILLSLSLFFTFVAQLEDMGKGDYGLLQIIEYVLLRIPQMAYEIFPLAVLMGTLFGVGALAGTRELVVMRAAGFTPSRFIRAMLMGGLLLVGVCYVLGDYVAPQALNMAQDLQAAALNGKHTARIEGEVWVRDGNRFINIRRLINSKLIAGVSIYEFNQDHRLQWSGWADHARIEADGWRLYGFSSTRFDTPELRSQHQDEYFWRTQVSADILNLFALKPEMLSTFGLYRYIAYLRDNGLQTSEYALAFWHKVVTPITVLVMILLALPFLFGPLRDVGTGQRILAGIGVGLFYYLLNAGIGGVGQVAGVNPALSAWLPTVLLGMAAWIGMRRVY